MSVWQSKSMQGTMVSTRGPRSRYFEKGEKVLCYEPDKSKAKVLYDSKILGTYETKDKRGRKHIQYKIHFQGWSSSWDRKVNADYVLKDTEENRQLQRDLAEKAQLQLGAYLYRKEHKSKKRLRKSTAVNSEDSADASASPSKLRPRGLSEDNFSSGSTFEKHDRYSMKDDCETDSCCSSIESFHDEDRVLLRISERLRQYLEYDYDMVVKYGKQHALPSRIPVVAILEKFVKQTALKTVFSNNQTEAHPRRRATQQRTTERKEKDVDKIKATVDLLKEVADGLRIYFDFTISEYLLYKEEKVYALSFLSEENLKNFTYVATPVFSLEWFNIKNDSSDTTAPLMVTTNATTATSTPTATLQTENIETQQVLATVAGGAGLAALVTGAETNSMPSVTSQEDQPQRRKLRSHRSDDCDFTIENCLSSIASTSSGASTPLNSNIPASSLNYLKSLAPISPQIRDFLQNVLSWRILPSNALSSPSMIFGAPHLARLIVKLPEFLNASTMSDEKLKIILQHLDTFVRYLESHKEWFNEDNYARTVGQKYTTNANDSVSEEKQTAKNPESEDPPIKKDHEPTSPIAKSPPPLITAVENVSS
ncbi:protein male-specific lethal-3 isoform X2 [Stomoxys calcitrans]|uniref:protein male-specific lethal-3 isoform X2 n=1 Tax=Stomoxys calcitrans TaxID=35570 RepID=UPI0027E25271|nr:protein male-specific lethal-3 isoform X2 [Stomoxys calcitrans]